MSLALGVSRSWSPHEGTLSNDTFLPRRLLVRVRPETALPAKVGRVSGLASPSPRQPLSTVGQNPRASLNYHPTAPQAGRSQRPLWPHLPQLFLPLRPPFTLGFLPPWLPQGLWVLPASLGPTVQPSRLGTDPAPWKLDGLWASWCPPHPQSRRAAGPWGPVC